MDTRYVRPVPRGDSAGRTCDGVFEAPDGLHRCGVPGPYELLWLGTSGKTVALCPRCLAKLAGQSMDLLGDG